MDVGSGKHPTILPQDRPPGTYYVGLDVSEAELRKAPEGSYDQVIVSDVANMIHGLNGQFDLIVTWFVLEHVKPLDGAFENMRTYLRPGGCLIAVFSGTFAAFALLNRAIPQPIGRWILKRLFGRPIESTFPAHYHHCWYSALERMLISWTQSQIVPYYTGAGYFRFSRVLRAIYVGYEEWTFLRTHRNLASYYLVTAVS